MLEWKVSGLRTVYGCVPLIRASSQVVLIFGQLAGNISATLTDWFLCKVIELSVHQQFQQLGSRPALRTNALQIQLAIKSDDKAQWKRNVFYLFAFIHIFMNFN